MAQNTEKLTRKQELAVMALITEPTIEKAAEKSGVGRTTMYRWMQLDSFQEQYQRMKHETVSQATARLRQGMTVAVDTLIDMAENQKTPAVARASAARTLLEFGLKAHEMEEIQQRLDAVEKQLNDGQTGRVS